MSEAPLVGAEADDAPGLYVHTPFCESKCSYCDFYSVARGDAPVHRYAQALAREAQARAGADFAPATVFVGGGTPTALADADFVHVLETVATLAVRGGRLREWTVECNPGSLTPWKASAMRAAGVTRVSIGVQSFDDDVLRSVGRVHDARTARQAVEVAREAGIPQVSVDLLFAIPGQGLATFRTDLGEAVRLGTDHVSAYALLYEEGTVLTRLRQRGRLRPEEEDVELEMLRLAIDTLGSAGFERYEVSNFARPGARCRHNLNYWRNGPYLGLGPSAVSYLDGERRANVAAWRSWEERVLAGGDAGASSERVDPRRAAAEDLMLRLRLVEGASLSAVERRRGVPVLAPIAPLVRRFADAGLLEVDAAGDGVRFTAAGFEVADGVLAEFLAAV